MIRKRRSYPIFEYSYDEFPYNRKNPWGDDDEEEYEDEEEEYEDDEEEWD
jgi:hypothetical protein